MLTRLAGLFLGISITALALGIAVLVAAAVAADGLYRADGILVWSAALLVVIGLGVAHASSLAQVFLARPRVPVLLGATLALAVVILWWFAVLVIGFGSSGFAGPVRDPVALLLADPERSLLVPGLPTGILLVLALIARRSAGRPRRSERPGSA